MSRSLNQASPISIRDQWAHKQAVRAVKQVWNSLLDPHGPPAPGIPRLPFPEDGSDPNDNDDTLPEAPSPPPVLKAPRTPIPIPKAVNIGIVGAGAAGLFTAMVLQYLNAQLLWRYLRRQLGRPPSDSEIEAESACTGSDGRRRPSRYLHFEYRILEANGEDRLGGRLFTYTFDPASPPSTHDYYDVGAMRFPDNPAMKRTFELFAKLGMKKAPLDGPDAKPGALVPYYMTNADAAGGSIQPWRFNDVSLWADSYDSLLAQSADADPFGMAGDGSIPAEIRCHSPDKVLNAAIRPFRDALREDAERSPPGRAGWDLLMQYDTFSTRQFLGTKSVLPPSTPSEIPPPPYNHATIQWMETFNGGTDWYDQAHSETVLESLDFDYGDDTEWWCVLGGAQELAKRMAARLLHKPTYHSPVTAIRAVGPMRVEVDVVSPSDSSSSTLTFDAVFSTTTLSCLGHMDTSRAGLNYATKQAVRCLGYGPASKVAIKFKRAWWIHDLGDYCIKMGGLGHSDLTTRTCVYPSYNILDDPDAGAAVLLNSYAWQQDSQRLASLMSSDRDHAEKVRDEARLKDLLIRELVRLHSNPGMADADLHRLVSDNYVDHHAFDWYKDPFTAGAFAFFRPQQFSGMWSRMIQPAGDVVIVGEAASPHHAWVVGALESAVHGLHAWLRLNEGSVPELREAREMLEAVEEGNPFVGLPPYMEPNLSHWQALIGVYHRQEHLEGRHGVAELLAKHAELVGEMGGAGLSTGVGGRGGM